MTILQNLYLEYNKQRNCNISITTFYAKYKKFGNNIFTTRYAKPGRPCEVKYKEYYDVQGGKPSRDCYRYRRNKGLTHEQALFMGKIKGLKQH